MDVNRKNVGRSIERLNVAHSIRNNQLKCHKKLMHHHEVNRKRGWVPVYVNDAHVCLATKRTLTGSQASLWVLLRKRALNVLRVFSVYVNDVHVLSADKKKTNLFS